MSAESFDLYVDRGRTLGLEVEYRDGDGVLVPFGVGWSGKAQIRTGYVDDDGALLLELTVVLQTPGIVVVSATDEQTAKIESARGRWDLILNDPAGNVWPILRGEALIRGRVTE